MTVPSRPGAQISLDRARTVPLADQISDTLKAAILEGRLEPGSRLPSWLDMATQLGVARGTVKAAYEKLADELLVIPSGAAGTRVAHQPAGRPRAITKEIRRPLEGIVRGYDLTPLPFQMGVPAHDAFPIKLWSRIRTRVIRDDIAIPVGQPDPRGNLSLRSQIASYLAIARGISCVPDQIILTGGYRNGLALVIRTLGLQGKTVWMEEPGYPITRLGLELDGMEVAAVPVDDDGLIVEEGIARAPDAALAIVTPGQQAPTGASLSPDRRKALLQWAKDADAWIIEDDYLSELQLAGRATPALAAADPHGRVIHIGSFGKTLSPSIGLGFVVAPVELAERFGSVAACLQPAPNPTMQNALARFIADGHYLRHLRHMKTLYAQRRDALQNCLGKAFADAKPAGLSFILRLPDGVDDTEVARAALEKKIAPSPLSPWFHDQTQAIPGLLLSFTNLKPNIVDRACSALRDVVRAA
jgi:GntR family transcriptional regulator/MocR family aminotransferase